MNFAICQYLLYFLYISCQKWIYFKVIFSSINTYKKQQTFFMSRWKRKLQLMIANSWLNHPYLDSQQHQQQIWMIFIVLACVFVCLGWVVLCIITIWFYVPYRESIIVCGCCCYCCEKWGANCQRLGHLEKVKKRSHILEGWEGFKNYIKLCRSMVVPLKVAPLTILSGKKWKCVKIAYT